VVRVDGSGVTLGRVRRASIPGQGRMAG
jgi:hypothetical protein